MLNFQGVSITKSKKYQHSRINDVRFHRIKPGSESFVVFHTIVSREVGKPRRKTVVSVIRSLNHPESSSLSVVLLYILRCTQGGTNISHLGKRKIIFKSALVGSLVGDMLVRGRVHQKKNPRDPFYSPVNYRLQEGMRTMVPRRAAATKPVGNIPLNRRWLMVGSFSRLTYKYIYICI